MGVILLIALLGVPIVELYVIVQVGEAIGVVPMLLLLVGISIAGSWLLKQQGLATYRRAQEVLREGGIPSRELTDGFLILLGGALLLTPGFVTDAVGLVLILPPTRGPLKRFFRTVIFTKLARRHPVAAGGMYSARVVRERRRSPGDAGSSTASPRDPERLPREGARPDGDDSRDRE